MRTKNYTITFQKIGTVTLEYRQTNNILILNLLPIIHKIYQHYGKNRFLVGKKLHQYMEVLSENNIPLFQVIK